MKISSERLYQVALVAGVLSIIGFAAYLIVSPSLWTMMGLLGFGGVFLVVAIVFFYVATSFEGSLDIMELF